MRLPKDFKFPTKPIKLPRASKEPIAVAFYHDDDHAVIWQIAQQRPKSRSSKPEDWITHERIGDEETIKDWFDGGYELIAYIPLTV